MEFIINFLKATWYLWALILLLGIIKLFRPAIKGFIGEKSVIVYLSRLDKNKYMILNNIMLQVGSKTTQIDHIVVSNYGVFVIETKNYKGWIIGSEKDDHWTQIIYKRKERFHNPIRQNYGHVQALKELLKDFTRVEYIPIVAFGFDSELKVKTTTPVVYFHRLKGEIGKHTIECISEAEKVQIYSKLQELNTDNPENRKAHVQTIKTDLASKEELIKNNICPKCGGMLLQRMGRRGPFTGCSNYPKCNFTA